MGDMKRVDGMERIFETFRRTARSLGRFRRAEEGSYLVYIGIAAIPMVAAAGLMQNSN